MEQILNTDWVIGYIWELLILLLMLLLLYKRMPCFLESKKHGSLSQKRDRGRARQRQKKQKDESFIANPNNCWI